MFERIGAIIGIILPLAFGFIFLSQAKKRNNPKLKRNGIILLILGLLLAILNLLNMLNSF